MHIGSVTPLTGIQSAQSLSSPSAAGAPATADAAVQTLSLSQQLEQTRIRADLSQLNTRLAHVEDLIRTASVQRARAATAVSALELGLDTEPISATTIRSVEEVNATPTSFSTFGPDWDGTSTAEVTLDGIYNGSLGDETLTFSVKQDGEHGVDNLRIEVRRSDNRKLEEFQIHRNDPLDTPYTLSTGLVLTLGSGALNRNESFTLDLFANSGSVVDPSKPMDGTRNDNPSLEYGLSVIDGSFDVNGISISVNAGDSIQQVLDRITASAANVTAGFDAATETVVLTHNQLGSAFDITLANDTSGFLAAVKLDSAVADPGNDGDANTVLANMDQFANVSSGSILVNRQAIAFNVNTDSLNDIIDRINTADVGATATLIGQKVKIVADDKRDIMRLDNNATGLFTALHIRAGRHEPILSSGTSPRQAREIAEALADAGESMNRVYAASIGTGIVGERVSSIRSVMENIISDVVADTQNKPNLDLGFEFKNDGSGTPFRFDEAHVDRLQYGLRNYFLDLRSSFIGDRDLPHDGMLGRLGAMLSQSMNILSRTVGNVGTLIDAFA